MQQFLVPAAGRQVDAKGNFFRYEEAGSGVVDQRVRVRTENEDLGEFLPGDQVELERPASRWIFEPRQGAATIRVGNGRMGSNRVLTSGVLTAKSELMAEAEAGRSYTHAMFGASLSTSFGMFAIRNNGTKIIRVDSWQMTSAQNSATNSQWSMRRDLSAIPTGTSLVAGFDYRRASAGPASTAQLYRWDNGRGATSYTGVGVEITRFVPPDSSGSIITNRSLELITPGTCMTLLPGEWLGVANTSAAAGGQEMHYLAWREI